MEVVYRCCCGIDVHKKVIVACLVNGGEQELREFGTTTSEIKTLANWLTESGCEMIAMESTGVFWKPLYNLFELMDLDAMIVNAAHMKALPGRKTDVKDAEWIADLLRHGLLKASYIPNREQRELREITRYRKKPDGRTLPGSKPSAKILEGANIKLDSVVKDITGKSARKLLQRIIDDDIPDSDEVSKLVHGRMRPKLDQIVASIEGITTLLQRKLLAQIIDHIDDLNRRIGELDKLVQEYMAEYEAAIKAIDEIPGIARRSAEVILAEIDWIWADSPVQHISAHGLVSVPVTTRAQEEENMVRRRKGNKALKTILTQCAKSAKTVKSSYFFAQYQRISARRGKNRATLAVAHSMLIAIYHILKNKTAFHDLGSDYYDSFNRDRKINSYLKRLKALGWEPDAIPSSA